MDNIRQFDNNVDFKQNIGIQNDTPSVALHISKTNQTTNNYGIQLGTDVNLYRSAANQIRIPDNTWVDSLTIDNALIANGQTVHNISTITDLDHTIQTGDYALLFSTGSSNRTCTLSLNSTSTGRFLFIKKIDSGLGNVVITPNGGTIDGSASFILTSQNDSAFLQCDGTNWNLVTSKSKATYQTLVVTTESEFLAAFTLLNSTLGGGTIILDADITLTANHNLDHSEIIIEGAGHRIIFAGYYIRITNRTCSYRNAILYGNVVDPSTDATLTLFKTNNATIDTSNYQFDSCTFNNILGTGDTLTPIIDFEATFAGSNHIKILDCLIIGASGTNVKTLCLNQTGNNTSVFSLYAILQYYSNTSIVSSNFGLIGSLHTPTSNNIFITDGSSRYNYIPGSTLNLTNLQIKQGPTLIDYQALGSITPATDYLMLLDSTTYALKKATVSTLGGSLVAGSNTQIQFNNSGAFGASSNLTWSGSVLSIGNEIRLNGSTSGYVGHKGLIDAGSTTYTWPIDTSIQDSIFMLQTSGITTQLKSIAFISSTDGWACGASGVILHTQDGGVTWTPQTSGTTNWLNSICAIYNIFICGDNGTILQYTGSNWISVHSGGYGLTSIFFIDVNTGWAYGTNGGYYTIDGGLNWTSIVLTGAVRCVFFTTTQIGWYTTNVNLYKTIDGGLTWNLSYTTSVNLWEIYFIDQLNGFIAGSSGKIYKTIDGGDNWTLLSSGVSSDFTKIKFISLTNGYVAGDTIRYTLDGGVTWKSRPDYSTYVINDISYINDNEVYTVGNFGNIQKLYIYPNKILSTNVSGDLFWASHVAGSTTQIQFNNNGLLDASSNLTYNSNILSINNELRLVGSTSGYVGHKSLATAGSTSYTWPINTNVPAPAFINQTSGVSSHLISVYFIDSTTGWACGVSGVILHTINGGVNWLAQTSGIITELRSIYFINSTTGWACGASGVILYTTDGGITWTPQTSGVPTGYFRSIFFIDNNTGWAYGSSGNSVYTVNGGITWTPITLSGSGAFSVFFITDQIGWHCALNNKIYKSIDGGLTWSTNYTVASPQFSIYFIDALNGWSCGASGKIYRTIDGGTTWTLLTSGTTVSLNSIKFISGTDGYVCGAGLILYTNNSGITWTSRYTGAAYLYSIAYISNSAVYSVGNDGTIVTFYTYPNKILSTDTNGILAWASIADNLGYTPEPALTKGNLTESTSSILTITGGTSSVIGSGVSIQVAQSNASTAGYLSSTDWNTFNNKMGTSYLDTDITLAANSDTKIATQKATKAYADALIAANNAMVYKGIIDCSTNPNYPAATLGWTYKVSVSGKIGGASGINVELGDMILCSTTTVAGDQATVGMNWNIIQVNIDGAVIGPVSSTDGNIVLFDGTTGKLIKNSIYSTSSFEPTLTKGNLTESTSSVLTITGGSNAVIGSGLTIQVNQASNTVSGYLSSTDWSTFNSKQPTLTIGNLTESTSTILTITGGSNAVIGSGTTIQIAQAGVGTSGYLSSTDWNTFNDKQSSLPTATSNNTLRGNGTSWVASNILQNDTTNIGINNGVNPINNLLYVYGTDNTPDINDNTQNMIELDGATDGDHGITYSIGSIKKWDDYIYRGENGVFKYTWNHVAKKDILVLSETGRLGLNKPSNIMGYHNLFISGGGSLDDLEVSGTFTKNFRILYEISITGNGSPNTFQWRTSLNNGITFGSYTTGIACSLVPVLLSNGVYVNFENLTGHTITDKWTFTAFQQMPEADLTISPMGFDECVTTVNYTIGSPIYVDKSYNFSTLSTTDIILSTGTTSAIYIGSKTKFNNIHLNIVIAAIGCTLNVEYSNGSTWTEVTISNDLLDETLNLTKSGRIIFSHDTFSTVWNTQLPAGMSDSDYNLYWLRLTSTSNITTAPTTQVITRNSNNRLSVYGGSLDSLPVFNIDSLGAVTIGSNVNTNNNKLQISPYGTIVSSTSIKSAFENDAANNTTSQILNRLSQTNATTVPEFTLAKSNGTLTIPSNLTLNDFTGQVKFTGFFNSTWGDLAYFNTKYLGNGTTQIASVQTWVPPGAGGAPILATEVAANSTAPEFRIYNPASTFYLGIRTAALTANRTILWPDSNGASGNFLSTNGSGTLTWSSTGLLSGGTSGRIGVWSSATAMSSAANFVFDTANYYMAIGGATTVDPIGAGNAQECIVTINGKVQNSATSRGNLVLSNNRALANVATGDESGRIVFASLNNATPTPSLGTRSLGDIRSILVGTNGANGFGADMVFRTKATGVASLAETFRIYADASGVNIPTGSNYRINGAQLNFTNIAGNTTVAQGGTGLTTVAAGSIIAYNTVDTATAQTSTSGNKVLQNKAGIVAWNSDVEISNTNYMYFGDSATDGSWRMCIVTGNFQVQKRESGTWNTKGIFS